MKEFLMDNTTVLQIVGGSIALLAALVGLFKRDTVHAHTHKLTAFGWFSLIVILVGATVNGTSKYYEFKSNIEINKKKDSIIDHQSMVLTAIKDEQESEAALNNPLWPLTIRYSLATKLTEPEFKDVVNILQSLDDDLTKLTDEQLRSVINASQNEALKNLLLIDHDPVSNRVMFSENDTSKAVYVCKTIFNQLRIIKTANDLFLVDSLAFTTNPPSTDKSKLSQLSRLDLKIHRNYFDTIPDKLIPQLWSNVVLQFSKQDPFIVKRKGVINYTNGSSDYIPRFTLKNVPGGSGTNLIYTLKYWNYKDPVDFDK